MALEHPSQLRAIPHNSILQQLGMLANTIGGVGEAVAKDPERFHALYRESPRFRRLMTMVEHAFKFTDLDVVKAYVDLFDPEPWLRRAAVAGRADRAGGAARWSPTIWSGSTCTTGWRASTASSTATTWTSPAPCASIGGMARDAGEQPIAIEPETRDNLHMLHALRLALIQRLMLLAVRVPDFSDRHATTHDTPDRAPDASRGRAGAGSPGPDLPGDRGGRGAELDFGEPATYRSAGGQSYLAEHQTIFRPIGRDYELIRRISSGVIYHVGAVG